MVRNNKMKIFDYNLNKLREDFLVVVTIVFISVIANYGYNNYILTGVAFGVLTWGFWKDIGTLFGITLIAGFLGYFLLLLICKLLKK